MSLGSRTHPHVWHAKVFNTQAEVQVGLIGQNQNLMGILSMYVIPAWVDAQSDRCQVLEDDCSKDDNAVAGQLQINLETLYGQRNPGRDPRWKSQASLGHTMQVLNCAVYPKSADYKFIEVILCY